MELKEPFVIYVAATNLEAHTIVQMFLANDIPAYAVEDQSGVSLWAFGTLPQFHRPKIWIEKSMQKEAAELIHQFEEGKRQRDAARSARGGYPPSIHVQCEECGHVIVFPASLDGTTQECARCRAYVDVGESTWAEEVGEAEPHDAPDRHPGLNRPADSPDMVAEFQGNPYASPAIDTGSATRRLPYQVIGWLCGVGSVAFAIMALYFFARAKLAQSIVAGVCVLILGSIARAAFRKPH